MGVFAHFLNIEENCLVSMFGSENCELPQT